MVFAYLITKWASLWKFQENFIRFNLPAKCHCEYYVDCQIYLENVLSLQEALEEEYSSMFNYFHNAKERKQQQVLEFSL